PKLTQRTLERIEPFATFINDVAKYVATSAPLGRQWHNATAIEGGLVQFVQNLKHSSGGDIGVHASISVAQALLAADAIDEVRLVVAPAIAGRGRRLLDGLPPIRLESLRSATSPTGTCLPTIASRGDSARPAARRQVQETLSDPR